MNKELSKQRRSTKLMARQYNSETEKDLHLLRLSSERIEKYLKELLQKEVEKSAKKGST